jgi:hypothetical protein
MPGNTTASTERCNGRAKTPAAERFEVPFGHRVLGFGGAERCVGRLSGGAQRRPLQPEVDRAETTGFRVADVH